jgi:hypothetical protein
MPGVTSHKVKLARVCSLMLDRRTSLRVRRSKQLRKGAIASGKKPRPLYYLALGAVTGTADTTCGLHRRSWLSRSRKNVHWTRLASDSVIPGAARCSGLSRRTLTSTFPSACSYNLLVVRSLRTRRTVL